MIAGGLASDLIGLAAAGVVFAFQRKFVNPANTAKGLD